jgi:hypothetical protein
VESTFTPVQDNVLIPNISQPTDSKFAAEGYWSLIKLTPREHTLTFPGHVRGRVPQNFLTWSATPIRTRRAHGHARAHQLAMGDQPLAYCEGCPAARTIGDPGECPPEDGQEFPTVFVVQIDRRDLVLWCVHRLRKQPQKVSAQAGRRSWDFCATTTPPRSRSREDAPRPGSSRPRVAAPS